MRYFVINEPYFALIKARNEKEAIDLYVEDVADDEDGCLENEIKEITRDHALIIFSRCIDDKDNKRLMEKDAVKIFNADKAEILGIDAALT